MRWQSVPSFWRKKAEVAAPLVSVIVPTYKRDGLLEQCLKALKRQDLGQDRYEIIVSDNAGSATTQQLVDTWSRENTVPIRYLRASERKGPAAARNVAWRAARGEIIAFTDDDCLPAPTWLREAVGCFVPGVVGIWGRIIVPITDQPTDYELDTSRLEEAEFVNANCFYRRDALEAVGGFDERFETAWREDSDLYFRLLENGGGFARCNTAVVVHPPRPARWGISLSQQKKAMFNALLYKKHPRLYRQRIQAAPPWRYYGSIAGVLLSLCGTLLHDPWLIVPGVAGWVVLTGQFCASRLARTSRAPAHILEMLVTSALIPPLSVFWRLRGAWRFRVLFF